MSYRNQNIWCFCLTCIFCFSFAGNLRGDARETLEKLKNPALTYLNKFGFSPETCLRICKIKNYYVTWNLCLDTVPLLGNEESERITAKLYLFLIGAQQIRVVPERAIGLKATIGEALGKFRKTEVFRTLTHTQKVLFFQIYMHMYGKHKRSWKICTLGRNSNQRQMRKTFSAVNLGSDIEDERESRKIPKRYPGSLN